MSPYIPLVAALLFGSSLATMDMGTCQMTCDSEISAQFTGLRPRSEFAGAPGKKGPRGMKGEMGDSGPIGIKGEPATPCICPEHTVLQDQINELRNQLQKVHSPRDCRDVMLRREGSRGGVFTIYPFTGEVLGVEVYCDTVTDGGGWIVFQRRMDGSENFYRDWNDYVKGFGNLNGEFWLGLENIRWLMSTGEKYELRVDMEDFEKNTSFAKYSTFIVGPVDTHYNATITGYSGEAGDSLTIANIAFSTKDKDYDTYAPGSCAEAYKGGWWYSACHSANLNGLYLRGPHESYANGVNWRTWKDYHYSLKFTEMKMRIAV